MAYKFDSEDNGNCRVYYVAEKGAVYCYQEDHPGRFIFYRCSRDGEPAYEVTPASKVPLPPGDTTTGRNLRKFLNTED